MTDVPARNAPMLAGWMMAAGFGAAAAGVSFVAMGLSAMGAAFVGTVILTGTGIVLGLPRRELPGPGEAAPVASSVAEPVAAPAPVVTPPVVAAAPMMAPVAAPVVAEPVVAAPVVAEPVAAAPAAAQRPAGLAAARAGGADDLKIIKGIGPKLEQLCHRLGYFHFDQIAGWTEGEVAWVDDNLEGFKGRVTRDRWVPQAKAIMTLGQDAFLKRLDAGEEF